MIKDRRFREERIWMFAVLLIIAYIMYVINSHIPMLQDDYRLGFVLTTLPDGSAWYTQNLIDSWSELASSWWNQRYHFTCGRLSDGICSLIMMLGGKTVFNVISAGAIIAYLWLLSCYCFKSIGVAQLLICFLLSIVFLPNIDGTVFWMAGWCNYFLPSILLLSLYLCIRKIEEGQIRLGMVLFASLLSVLCGAFHEGLGVPLFAALFANGVVKILKKEKNGWPYWVVVVCVGIGSLVPASAPAMWNRASSGNSLLTAVGGLEPLLRQASIPLITFAWLVWKGKIRSTVLGWSACSFFALSLAVGAKGSWGGGYYYMSFSVMLLLVVNYAETVMKLHKMVLVWGLLVFSVLALVMQYAHAVKIEKAARSAFTDDQSEDVRVVDCSAFGRDVPWILGGIYPKSVTDYKYLFVGACHGVPPFVVLYRTREQDPNVYQLFSEESKDVEVRKYKDTYVLKLPARWDLPGNIVVSQPVRAKSSELILSEYRFGILPHIKGCLVNRKLGRFERDWYNGCYYVFLPIEVQSPAVVSFTLEYSECGDYGKRKTVSRPVEIAL